MTPLHRFYCIVKLKHDIWILSRLSRNRGSCEPVEICKLASEIMAECSPKVLQNAPRAFCNIFDGIKLPFVIKIFVLSIFEWPFYTGFTVLIGSFMVEKKREEICLFPLLF